MHKIKRHRDGFKDILDKLISTLKQYIEKFKQLDSNKKIIVLLNKALQSAVAISMAKNAIEIKKNLKSLKYWGEKINQEKSRNPEYEPSADNIYYRRQAQVIAQGSAIIVKMIAILVSSKFEKKIVNNGSNNQDGDDMIVTHDSMPWAMRKHKDSFRLRKHKDDALQMLVDKAKIAVETIDTFCKKMVRSFPTLSRIAALILSIKGILGTLGSVSSLGATAYMSTVTAIKHGTKQLKNTYVQMGDGTYLKPLRYMMLKLIDLLMSIIRILMAKKISGYLVPDKEKLTKDYGVKGMQKGKHLKAKDDPKQAGGVQKKKCSSRTAI